MKSAKRQLEIGPFDKRLQKLGWEAASHPDDPKVGLSEWRIDWGKDRLEKPLGVCVKCDRAEKVCLCEYGHYLEAYDICPGCTFDTVYASHVLEHVAWNLVPAALAEALRILKPGGVLEVWVPNMDAVLHEVRGKTVHHKAYTDHFWRGQKPSLWRFWQFMTYNEQWPVKGDTSGLQAHRSCFTYPFLEELLLEAGFSSVRRMESSEVRGIDHGWINLGARAVK